MRLLYEIHNQLTGSVVFSKYVVYYVLGSGFPYYNQAIHIESVSHICHQRTHRTVLWIEPNEPTKP